MIEAKRLALPWAIQNHHGSIQHYVVDANGVLVAAVPGMRRSMAEAIIAAPRRIEQLEARVRSLEEAAAAVLAHRDGTLPIRGWLRDTDNSRQALADRVRALENALAQVRLIEQDSSTPAAEKIRQAARVAGNVLAWKG